MLTLHKHTFLRTYLTKPLLITIPKRGMKYIGEKFFANTKNILMDYSEFLKYVNPLFNYNYFNNIDCINDDYYHLQVLFVPNIHNSASLIFNSKD